MVNRNLRLGRYHHGDCIIDSHTGCKSTVEVSRVNGGHFNCREAPFAVRVKFVWQNIGIVFDLCCKVVSRNSVSKARVPPYKLVTIIQWLRNYGAIIRRWRQPYDYTVPVSYTHLTLP